MTLLQALSELLIGSLFGWVLLIALGAVRGACDVISQQIGIGAARIVDPLSSVEEGALGRFATPFALLVFFLLDLHHLVIRAAAASFDWLPPGALSVSAAPGALGALAAEAGTAVVAAAATLALPVIAAMLLVSIAQGLLGRLLPEAEVLVLGMPVRLAVGMTVLAGSLSLWAPLARRLVADALAQGRALLEAVGG